MIAVKYPAQKKYGHSPKGKAAQRKYNQSPKGKANRREYARKYRKLGKAKQDQIKYDKSEKGKQRNIRYYIKSRKNIKCRLSQAIRSGMWRSLHKKAGKTFHLLGYTIEELKTHLEKQFQSGMTWDNYGEWHIDHKIPVSAFNFDKPDQIDFKHCWALENLQPMWNKENIAKGARLRKHFQPSLKLKAG